MIQIHMYGEVYARHTVHASAHIRPLVSADGTGFKKRARSEEK